jgi:uncharacterized protein YgiB involved in biofilm formation
MKRSTQIGLTAGGVLLIAGAWSLFGGEDEQLVYADAAECIAGGRLTSDECHLRFAEAEASHVRDARKFATTGECEAEFGQGRCVTRRLDGVPVIVPALAGLALTSALLRSRGTAQPLLPPTRQACPPGSPAPECQPRSSGPGGSVYSGGGSASRSAGPRAYTTTAGQPLVLSGAAPRTTVASQGGFGSIGRAFGSSSS